MGSAGEKTEVILMQIIANGGIPPLVLPRSIFSLGKILGAFLRCFPAEFAHQVVVGTLARLPPASLKLLPQLELGKSLATTLPGVGGLAHPLGLAAGFDKSARCFPQLGSLGFALLEVGTITPLPQGGNPKPRIFRLPEQRALINRLGFNNDGLEVISQRIEKGLVREKTSPLGINLGMNKATPLALAMGDYLKGLRKLHLVGDYFVVNISSPNTPLLRSLAKAEFIQELSQEVRAEFGEGLLPRLWIKLDPDLPKKSFQGLIASIAATHFAGVILSNTHKVNAPWAGGISGHPLALASTACLEWAWEVHRGSLAMMASGGVLSGEDVFQKIIRGAAVVQLYTAMVYRGPWVVWELLNELGEALALRGFPTVSEARGSYYLP